MGKKIACLAVIMALAISVFGCADKKKVELTPQMETNIKGLINMGVYHEVYTKYGLEPGVTVDKIDAQDESTDSYYKITFIATGSYTVKDSSDDLYSGTFKIDGYWEAHGGGTGECKISEPKCGSKTLPEQNVVSEIAEVLKTEATTTAEITESTMYQPLAEYISSNTPETGRVVEKVFESDVNKDGYPDLCVTVLQGSGVVSSAIVVYDVQNGKGYILDERSTFDYKILGAAEDVVAVCRTPFGKDGKTYGTLAIEGDKLVFVENEEMGATTPVNN